MENPPSAVPPDLLPTSDWPNVVFVRKDMETIITELTVPFNSLNCINSAHNFKTLKRQILLSDLEARGYITHFVAVEVGALGHYFSRVCTSLHHACPPLIV